MTAPGGSTPQHDDAVLPAAADQMVVLTTTLQKLATKRVVAFRNGPLTIEEYPRDWRFYRDVERLRALGPRAVYEPWAEQ
jgi:hypothetical protein